MNEHLMFMYNSEAKVSREGEISHSVAVIRDDPQRVDGWNCWLSDQQNLYSISTAIILVCIRPRSSVLFIHERIQSNHEVRPLREWMRGKAIHATVMRGNQPL